MATYAIGDVQGCLGALRRLLDAFGFDRARDQLWFVGDLVNRGPDSLATLRLVKDFGDVAVTVLGNHDFHLLAVSAGYAKTHRSDTLDAVLDAPDREELLAWLRQRPMLHVQGKWAMVHAGLLPQWSVATAQRLAREVETALRGADWRQFLARLYGDTPDSWNEVRQRHGPNALLHSGGRDRIPHQRRDRQGAARIFSLVRCAWARQPRPHDYLRPLVHVGAETAT